MVHQFVVCRQHDQVFVQRVLVSTSPEQMKTDCCQVLPLVLEFPFPDSKKMGCYQVLEFQLVALGQLQAFQFLVRPSLLLQQQERPLEFLPSLWLLPWRELS